MLGFKPLWERVKAERLAQERDAGHAEGRAQGRAEGRAELLAELGLTDPQENNASQNNDR